MQSYTFAEVADFRHAPIPRIPGAVDFIEVGADFAVGVHNLLYSLRYRA